MTYNSSISRRKFIKKTGLSATVALSAAHFPVLGNEATKLSLSFFTIPDPDGWHPSLRLRGDWLIIKISDNYHSGYGEASHSKNDKQCIETVTKLFEKYFSNFKLTLANLVALEREYLKQSPDLVTATAFSGINQALYELLAKQNQIPVWRLFTEKPSFDKIRLYTTINRALKERTIGEYIELVEKVRSKGFTIFKCAPFEKVNGPERVLEKSQPGLETLQALRNAYPDMGIRIDFHERFEPEDFFRLLPDIEAISPDWIEEPFELGNAYTELKKKSKVTIAGGELFWGTRVFQQIIDHKWVDVIMPDVKHVGGFGPLLNVFAIANGKVDVSPHNPAGPISTAATCHALATLPNSIQTLEYAFDGGDTREKYGEQVENGFLYLSNKPGWGLDLE